MSTTFGIKLPDNKITEVAFRHGIGNNMIQIDISNPLICLLPKDTPLIAIDNSNQGINTIGDLLKKDSRKIIKYDIDKLYDTR
jgi:hypothetical protein